MFELTAYQRDLLYVIEGLGSVMGLAIKAEIDEYYAAETNYGRLYPNLDRLVDKGFVAKGTIDNRTNSYSLTKRGHDALEARREWENQYLARLRDDSA